MNAIRISFPVLLSSMIALAAPTFGEESNLPLADFLADPGWEGFRNRLLPEQLPRVMQDFGYRRTNHAHGSQHGEIGGRVQRSSAKATYGQPIPTLTLNDKLTATGRLAVTDAQGGSGALIGWYHHDSRGWRTPNSLGLRIDGNGGKYWLFYEYGTRHYQTGGGGAFEGDRYQTTPTKPFPADGTVHTWAINYDPSANDGHGLLEFRVDDKDWVPVKLPPGHKEDGAEFDRFGIWNVQLPGDYVEFYLDDLVVNGEPMTFDDDPKWTGVGNGRTYTEKLLRPHHDFGFTPTNYAGGKEGEIGGTIFRDEAPAYYAAKTEPLSLDKPLHASGKIALTEAASDSGVCLGWFDAESKRSKNDPEYQSRQKNCLGIMVEGPSRIGHYFRPMFTTSAGQGITSGPENFGGKEPSVIAPNGQPHEWTLDYDPHGADGQGSITVTFDGVRQTLALRPGDKQAGATFDRFGFYNLQAGGHYVRIFVDDLRFTSGQ